MPSAMINGRPYGTGRRKNAIARVFLSPGEGQVRVNNREFENYFPRDILRMIVRQPFAVLELDDKFDVMVTVKGGGIAAQAEAIRHGIARALLNVDSEHRGTLKKAGFLTRDARKKERNKPGQPGARKKFQYSKR